LKSPCGLAKKSHGENFKKSSPPAPADLFEFSAFWQPGFVDRLLRNDENYAEKWDYVWRNPVRAGLVNQPEQWPYQGEIFVIDRA
jgi:putative transposase